MTNLDTAPDQHPEQHSGPAESADSGTTRADFLKWSTAALGGLYVGPRITSFAVGGAIGQAGSPAPGPSHTSPAPRVPPAQAPLLPVTGGAAGNPPAADAPPGWLPAAGVGAMAAGWAIRQRMRQTGQPVEVEDDDTQAP